MWRLGFTRSSEEVSKRQMCCVSQSELDFVELLHYCAGNGHHQVKGAPNFVTSRLCPGKASTMVISWDKVSEQCCLFLCRHGIDRATSAQHIIPTCRAQ